jgi:hypothetical protein
MHSYRFAVPRTSFFTLRFFDPRAYSRGFSGLSVFFFLRAARFSFFRSSLPNVAVFAMSAIGFLLDKFSAVPTGLGYSSYAPPFPALKRWAIIGRPSGALISRTAGKKREASSLKPRATAKSCSSPAARTSRLISSIRSEGIVP